MREVDLLARLKRDVEELGVRGMARAANVSPAYISEVVKGTRHIGAKIAKHYGLKLTRTIERVYR